MANGRLLHDCHAETLAIRSFNHFLTQECAKLAAHTSQSSQFIARKDSKNAEEISQPFTFRDDRKIHMYISEAPCGDASMELVMRNQADSTPWPTDRTSPPEVDSTSSLLGRGYFSKLGVVRRKPARADSTPSLSKSCSDKLAMTQVLSLLSSLSSLVICPANVYLSSVIIPSSEYVEAALRRSFSAQGRMKTVGNARWPGEYAFHEFRYIETTTEFRYSKRAPRGYIGLTTAIPRSSNMSTAWNPYIHEVLINGSLQGWKQSNPKCASCLARASSLRDVSQMLRELGSPSYTIMSSCNTYRRLKDSELLRHRKLVKQATITKALPGWIQNVEDDFVLSSTLGSCENLTSGLYF